MIRVYMQVLGVAFCWVCLGGLLSASAGAGEVQGNANEINSTRCAGVPFPGRGSDAVLPPSG